MTTPSRLRFSFGLEKRSSTVIGVPARTCTSTSKPTPPDEMSIVSALNGARLPVASIERQLTSRRVLTRWR